MFRCPDDNYVALRCAGNVPVIAPIAFKLAIKQLALLRACNQFVLGREHSVAKLRRAKEHRLHLYTLLSLAEPSYRKVRQLTAGDSAMQLISVVPESNPKMVSMVLALGRRRTSEQEPSRRAGKKNIDALT